jgi:aspartate carbamoyltransferase regulatory subunit
MPSLFHVIHNDPESCTVCCHYCERKISKEDIVLI